MTEEIMYDASGVPVTRDLRTYGAPKIGDIPKDYRLSSFPVMISGSVRRQVDC